MDVTKTHTLSAYDLMNICRFSRTAFFNFTRGRDLSVYADTQRRYHYSLADVVVFLRERRKLGLYGHELASCVRRDARLRKIAGGDVPDLEIDGNPAALRAVLSSDEAARARGVVGCARAAIVRRFWMQAHLVPDSVIESIILHPSVVRYILTGQTEEFAPDAPALDDWIASYLSINFPPIFNSIKEAA